MSTLLQELSEKNVQFEKLFIEFQTKVREKGEKYLNSEGFQDCKIIFDLYANGFQYKGFNSNSLNGEKVGKFLQQFDIFRQRALIYFLIESLKFKGNASHAEEFYHIFKKTEILCNWKELKACKCVLKNFTQIVLNLSSYNLFSLIISTSLFFGFALIIYFPAPISSMEILDITKSEISKTWIINHAINVLLYTFDFDDVMSVKPLNFAGGLLMIFMKVFIVLIITNYILKELISKFKL